MAHYGGIIDPTDLNDPRTRIVNLIPPGSYVLEIGCGSGTIIGYLAGEKSCRTLAVEPDAVMADKTASLGVEVLRGSIEDAQLQQQLAARGPFDAIIFADVLEHLQNPWEMLSVVRPWLGPRGAVLASIPNVAHWTIRLNLLLGKWDYTTGYLMDQTHLRWFTQKTARQLFTDTGYYLTSFHARWAALPGDRLWQLLPGRTFFYNTLVRLWPGLFGYQFIISAEPEKT